ncbi:hypothetical protein [Vallitalea okinawensis]|uniref:hypothetical protein n=1 Tax=Vallitalea okinawensis TaxID=2078660 RepID=UPI000CFC677B|nr:hypothetical protein [Vallitalea okinawensis]
MKKSRILALVLAVAVMMMGAGYAYWSDAVTLTTTVSTAQLDLYFDNTLDTVTFNSDNEDVAVGSVDYSGTADEPNSDAVVVLDKLYPGATADLTLVILNDSTIPVQFSSLGFSEETPIDGVTINKSIKYDGTTYDLESVNLSELPDIPAQEPIEVLIDIDVSTTGADVAENGSYSFSFNPTFTQFNND